MTEHFIFQNLVLRVHSGPSQGLVRPIFASGTQFVGRGPDQHIAIDDAMLSRSHAAIEIRDGAVHIEDLGSTNGVFVNSKRIASAFLQVGDQIVMGSSVICVETHPDPASLIARETANLRAGLLQSANARTAEFATPGRQGLTADVNIGALALSPPPPASSLAGKIEEVSISDVLQLCHTLRKDGVLCISSPSGEGAIHIEAGAILSAEISGKPNIDTFKAVTRILCWKVGNFELTRIEEGVEFVAEEDDSEWMVQEILIESMRQIDQYQVVRSTLPTGNRVFRGPIDVDPNALDLVEHLVLQHVGPRGCHLQVLLDETPATDLEIVEAVRELIQRGELHVE